MRYHPAADVFPLLAEPELAELAEDIRANGLLEPVWLIEDDGETLVLDGRNRLRACEMVGVTPETRLYQGADPIGFALSLNMKRRHLTNGQRAAVGAKVEPLYAEEAERVRREAIARARSKTVADLPPSQTNVEPESEQSAAARFRYPDPKPQPKPSPQPKARDKAAATAGTSGRAVGQFKRVEQEAPDLAEKVKSGELALDRAERIIRDRAAEAKRVEEAKREAAMAEQATTVDIRHGDFREVLADVSEVDAIITDPPYPREFLPLLADLASWADKVLTPDGVMAVLMGQTHLPEVYRLLSGHRPYRWTACYYMPGSAYRSHSARVQSSWKPLIVYGGGPRFGDIIRSEGSDADAKNHHKWGQDYSAFHTIVERLTRRGQTVVDPFMGSGTTLLAAHAQGRHAIGCDVDPESVKRAKERLT